MLKARIYNEFCGTEKELGPYYVEIGPATVSVFMNSSSIHKDGLLVFADCSTGQRGKRHVQILNAQTRLCRVVHPGRTDSQLRHAFISSFTPPRSGHTDCTVLCSEGHVKMKSYQVLVSGFTV